MLRSPLDQAKSVLTYRATCSVAGQCNRGLGFLYQRFSSLLGDEACQFRNQQSRTVVKFGDHSSIWDSWPIAFLGYPREPRVGWETGCPKHAAPNLPAETRSRTRVSREPQRHRQRNLQRWSGSRQAPKPYSKRGALLYCVGKPFIRHRPRHHVAATTNRHLTRSAGQPSGRRETRGVRECSTRKGPRASGAR